MNLQSMTRGDKHVHQHRFQLLLHMDGCHYYVSNYRCVDCNAIFKTYDERDPKEDPWSLVWMEPSVETVRRDEKGRFIEPYQRVVKCERCERLQAGAKAIHETEFVPTIGVL
jgi:hypothetical protein